MRFWPALLACLIVVFPAYAFTIEEGSSEATMTIQDYIKNYVDVPKGGTDWKVFGTTKEIEVLTKTEGSEGDYYYRYYYKPDFQPEVKALDGKEITVKGYMFPLDGAEGQKQFLLGPFPLTCPYQYHVGPSLVLEVHADKNPITFGYEPIVITGMLELVSEDPENSVFYRLKDARQVK